MTELIHLVYTIFIMLFFITGASFYLQSRVIARVRDFRKQLLASYSMKDSDSEDLKILNAYFKDERFTFENLKKKLFINEDMLWLLWEEFYLEKTVEK